MEDKTLQVDFVTIRPEVARRVDSVIDKVKVREEDLEKSTTEFMTSLQFQMKAAGITEKELDDPDFNQSARTIFFEDPQLEINDNPKYVELKTRYPKLVSLAEANHSEILKLNSQHTELLELKKELLPELHSELENEFRSITSHIDYGTGLKSNSAPEFVYDMCTLTDLVIKPENDEDEYEFDRKRWAHERAKDITKKLAEKNLIKIAENTLPSPEETSEAKKELSKVGRTIKQIEFHNDLAGFQKTKDYAETPPITKLISRLPKSRFSTASVQKISENPYLEKELGAIVKSERSELELNKRITWTNAIDTELIYSIIEKLDTNSANLDKTSRNTIIGDVFNRYQEMFRKAPSNRGENPNALNRDQYFVDLVNEAIKELNPMTPIDRRILNSQMVALYYLFNAQGLDQIYENYLNSIPPNETPTNKQEEWKAKSILAMDFLRRNAKKNRESILERRNTEAPTVGIEYEYADNLEGLLTVNPDIQAFIDQLQKTIAGKKDKGEDSASDEEFLKNLEQFQEGFKKKSWQVLFGDQEYKPSAIQLLSMIDLLTKDSSVTNIVSQLGTFEEDISHSPSYREIITEPSISYRMQMREIVQTMARGSLDGNLNPHFTVGNVELSPEKPEASEFRVWLMAAGLVDNDEIVFDDNYVRSEEHFWKSTSFDNKRYYLPFHYVRNGPEMKRYNTKYKPSGFEIRTFTGGTGEKRNFVNHIRSLSLISSAAFGLQAYQKDSILRNSKEKKLATLYEKLNNDWRKVLDDNNISFLPLDQRFAEVEIEDTDTGRQLKYLDQNTKDSYRKYITDIQKARISNPNFSSAVKKLLGDYRRKVNQIVGY